MKRILIATDLSTRSDRALRRAVLLARETGAALSLLHAIDDDQPPHMLDAQVTASGDLLDRTAETIRDTDGVAADFTVAAGAAFETIARTADEVGADMVVIGPHRRHFLDSFIGTTAERIIRRSGVPVLLANAVPSAAYRRALVAVDFDDTSRAAISDLSRLDLLGGTDITALHVFDAPAIGMMQRAMESADAIDHYVTGEKGQAETDMRLFLAQTGLSTVRPLLKPNRGSPSGVILDSAREEGADLIVVGTNQRKGFERLLIGSVAQGVLVNADCDVLVVPVPGNSGVDP